MTDSDPRIIYNIVMEAQPQLPTLYSAALLGEGSPCSLSNTGSVQNFARFNFARKAAKKAEGLP